MSTQTPNLGLVKPADEEFYDVQIQNQNMDKLDQAVIAKLDKTGDSKDNTVTFVEATSRTAISSTDNHSLLFGKIKKWFTDLGTAAFKNVGTTSSSVAAGDAPATTVSTHNSSGSAHSSLFAAKLSTSLKGAANGLAELDASGKVPSAQLPSYVDDVLEYATSASFPATGETGKIYVALNTNLTYRWSGSAYVEISPGVALGETSSTAYRGDRGALAYAHSQATGNPHGLTAALIGAYGSSNLPLNKYAWRNIQNYMTAGTYTFAAPDLFNGASYEIGIYIIGAGGSGAAYAYYTNSTYQQAKATGGASGYAREYRMTVPPGLNLIVVVGAGGAGVGGQVTDQYGTNYGKIDFAGNNGGSSSFNGFTVLGGKGGFGYIGNSGGVSGSDGGMGSSGIYYMDTSYAPAMGIAASSFEASGSFIKAGTSDILSCLNPFNGLRYLGAGGAAGVNGSDPAWNNGGNPWAQTIKTLDDGLSAGRGVAGVNSGNLTAGSATSPGSGGGAIAGGGNYGGHPVLMSGRGADGAVMIYARMAVA